MEKIFLKMIMKIFVQWKNEKKKFLIKLFSLKKNFFIKKIW